MLIGFLLKFLIIILSYINLGLSFGIIVALIRILINWIAPNISQNEYTFMQVLYKLTEPTLSRARRWIPINYKGVDFSPIMVIFIAILTKIFIIVFLMPIIFIYLR